MANKHYDWRFRKRSARLVLDTGRPISAVAKEVGVNPMTLSRWVKIQYELDSRDSQAAARAQKIKDRRLAKQQRNETLDKNFLAVMKSQLPENATKSDKFDLMEKERANFDLSRMARLLGVTKGGFYKHIEEPRRQNRIRQKRLNDKLDLFVHQSWLDSNQTFGATRITAQLLQQYHWEVKVNEVRRSMHRLGIRGKTNSSHIPK
ncbi:MAG: IS3 family transposase [Corynebacterium sp.]|nr:IS3 family transposase [Corynebacterium sp.]